MAYAHVMEESGLFLAQAIAGLYVVPQVNNIFFVDISLDLKVLRRRVLFETRQSEPCIRRRLPGLIR